MLNVAQDLLNSGTPMTNTSATSAHNTTAFASHVHKSNNAQTKSASECNTYAGFDALLWALYTIERRLSDENENDTSGKSAHKRTSKPNKRLFSVRL